MCITVAYSTERIFRMKSKKEARFYPRLFWFWKSNRFYPRRSSYSYSSVNKAGLKNGFLFHFSVIEFSVFYNSYFCSPILNPLLYRWIKTNITVWDPCYKWYTAPSIMFEISYSINFYSTLIEIPHQALILLKSCHFYWG